MDLVEHHLVWMSDAPEPRDEGEDGQNRNGKLVVPLLALLNRPVGLHFLNYTGDFLGQRLRVRRDGTLFVLSWSLADAASR